MSCGGETSSSFWYNPSMEFNSLVPELYVSNFQKSLEFYVDTLGFKVEYDRQDPLFALLSYGKAQLMIQQQAETDNHTGSLEHPYGRGINFQIETQDINDLVARLERDNYRLRREVKDYWRKVGNELIGDREIQVLDPDGYFLRFSQYIGTKPLNHE
jgi:catechol 2,3-dioxygenase-like lactoylglutathione lyase family enzyme